ncbi:hypothetical protein ELI49_24210 [Rhizobium ruizarguesonis]|uniref:ABC-three component system protein n=1 Tax=Rhizobium TaxID=379 RepID=UPI00102FAF32|nr:MULTISPECIES: ABC-three component system protein [Rhizobium]MBY2994505.1 hypothetical protein [Rhizobium leguminosarum]MBY3058933.1 hypothetical protein [Rhizobium leguminosarum]TAU12643.1 hypothetical protein ELI49_24210 [Rhizobium ruizarguesonis]
MIPAQSRAISTTQTNNEVGGHMAGNDLFANAGPVYLINNYNPAPPLQGGPPSVNVFRKLFAKLEKEAAEDKLLSSYIRQLEVYTRQVEDEKVIGLEEKLRLAGRDDQVVFATGLKENVYGEIKANQFSRAYQLIVATLMAKVHERFNSQVRHLINAGVDASLIDQAVSNIITTPIANELDECPQFEDVAIDYVRGMIYFLTGNCHIRWD